MNLMVIYRRSFQILILLVVSCSVFAKDLRLNIPIGGNSWVKGGGEEKVVTAGLLNWNNPHASIETYIRLTKTGKIKLYLTASVTGKSEAQVTVLGQSREMVMEEGNQKDYYAGEWEVKTAGYLKIELRGLSKTAEIFGTPSQWILEGSMADESASFVKDSKDNYFYWGRRGPSVHLNYPVAAEEQVEWFYNEVTVPEQEDVIGSYFMADGFGEGYFGMQVNSDQERRILFSVWSPFKTDDPKSIPKDKQIVLLKKGADVYAGEFGNEGSGGQSYLKYNWKAGNTYKFLLHGKPTGDSTTTYTAYFFAPESGKWNLIASFKRPKTNTYLKRLHSFLENFIPNTGNIGRMVYFGNQWVRNAGGRWTELANAKFSADATARKGYRMDYAGGMDGNRFFLKNCGFFDVNTEIGKEFVRQPQGVAPKIDFDTLP
jgi:hypothetical protein